MTHGPGERCPVQALCPACAVIARDALMIHAGLEPLSATQARAAGGSMSVRDQQVWAMLTAQNSNERAAIVAWLRRRPGYGPVADAIERGEHHKKEVP